ncbi:MAG: hypothetical protein H0X39_12645 [Actinobacteria bacterium]|nr:hypothetical protein [Actinomycetota bacterium]
MDGVLLGRWAAHYVLLMPHLVQSGGSRVPLEGLVEVPAENVVFVQVLVAAS